ncbi:hypothetical protein C8Q74DRAFT_1222531 [Fomes fomentarius]|nr:hypothetical protein C8Q74DRAFT_1222531 [Fomes fomentarius]
MDPTQYELEIAQSTFIIRVASAVAFCILYYDWVLTLSAEVDRFWKRRLSWVSFGYYLNRGLALLGHIPVIYEFYFWHIRSLTQHRSQTCSKLQMYHQILSGVMPVVVGALQIARVYALYESSQRVLIGLVGMAVWAITQAWKTHDAAQVVKAGIVDMNPIICDLRVSANHCTLTGCHRYCNALKMPEDPTKMGRRLACHLAPRRVHILRVHGHMIKQLTSWLTLCLGSVLLLCNSTNVFTCLLAPPAYRGISVTISNVIATTLIARLMLNLRKPNLVAYSYQYEQGSTTF